jgi:hypothetical protein
MLRELLESDVELLMYLAGFLIERKEKRLSRFAKAITAESQEETEGVQSRELKGSGGLDDYTPDPDDDDFDEDELWDDVDDDFESEDYDDEYFEEYDDSDDDYFDD